MSGPPAGYDGPPFLRVERGSPDPIELGALTTVLYARLAAAQEEPQEAGHPSARWRRLERAPGFRGPRTWQHGPS
ncbi:acyl-CoA carboxylase subunit epsilon [Kitasatospora sp. NPDC058444]|uniref:acyl-CoA carboxylase subunit epsilon n=1 Tax=Kitasatospora sp. NPDC058444 TaxID=3346504 RepID=UPI003655FE18